MERYKLITYFENRRRLNTLHKFLSTLNRYFANTQFSEWRISEPPEENNTALEARTELNKSIPKANKIILASGQSPVITWTPPPAIGGRIIKVNMVTEIFRLHRFQINVSELLDVIERSIGVYEANRVSSILRTCNPFFWFMRIISAVASIPFFILGNVGFSRTKIEGSLVGRVFKFIFELAAGIVSIITILELTDTLQPVLEFLHIK